MFHFCHDRVAPFDLKKLLEVRVVCSTDLALGSMKTFDVLHHIGPLEIDIEVSPRSGKNHEVR